MNQSFEHDGIITEQNYKQLFTQVPAPIAIYKGKELRYVFLNDAYSKIFNGRNILGKTVREAFPELKGQGYYEILENVFTSGNPYYGNETPALIDVNNNGNLSTHYYNLVYTPFRNEEGVIEGVMAFGHDVTDQVEARKKVEDVMDKSNFRNALLEAHNEATPDGVLIVNTRGKMLLHNKRFTEIWKIPEEIIDNEDDEAALQYAMTQLKDPQAFIDRVTYLYNQGKEKSYDEILFNDGRVIERYGTPIIAENGLYYGWAWYFRDITERIKQEQKFRNVVEQSPEPILILKGENMVLEVANEPLLKLWKVGRETIGKTFLEILPEMKGQGFMELLLDVYRNGVTHYGFETPAVFERSDGEKQTVYFNFVYQPYREIDGSITGVLVLATDVTEQVAAKQRLIESEKRFRSLIMQAPVGICILRGEELYFEIANDSYLTLARKKREEILGRTVSETLPEATSYGFVDLLRNVLKTGEPFYGKEYEVQLPRNGSLVTIYVDFVYEPLKEDDGTISRIMVLATEVTDKVLARRKIEESEQELQMRVKERTEELEKKNIELEQYAHVSSHDLQEPLRKITTFIDMVKEKDYEHLSDASKTIFNKISLAAQRMSNTLKDLLNFATLSKEAQFETVNLNEVMASVINDLELIIAQKNAEISYSSLPEIRAIPLQMHQLFYNLINNALKFSRPGIACKVDIAACELNEEEKSKELTLNDKKDYYKIIVKDNGIGFDQNNATKIFTMFKRLHNKHQYGGTGIGLALCKKVALNHGGDIHALSVPNEGSSFVIFLPAE